jgi:signal transduction histidine kinase
MNLLDISKADEGRLTPRLADVDAHELVTSVLAELEVMAQAKQVALAQDVNVARMRVDEDLVRRLTINLAENAVRHAPSQSTVVVAITQDGAELNLRVVDAGRGVPSEMRDKIFDPFVQVEGGSAVVARTGRGLGLTFCKLVAEAHGGRIWVEDALPGSAFCVRLPVHV